MGFLKICFSVEITPAAMYISFSLDEFDRSAGVPCSSLQSVWNKCLVGIYPLQWQKVRRRRTSTVCQLQMMHYFFSCHNSPFTTTKNVFPPICEVYPCPFCPHNAYEVLPILKEIPPHVLPFHVQVKHVLLQLYLDLKIPLNMVSAWLKISELFGCRAWMPPQKDHLHSVVS